MQFHAQTYLNYEELIAPWSPTVVVIVNCCKVVRQARNFINLFIHGLNFLGLLGNKRGLSVQAFITILTNCYLCLRLRQRTL